MLQRKPRELSSQFGYSSLENSDLLSLILRYGTKRKSVNELSALVTPIIENALEVGSNSQQLVDELARSKSLGVVHQHVVAALYELLLRQKSRNNSESIYSNPSLLVEKFYHLRQRRQEYLYGVYLSPRLALVRTELLAKGTTDAVIVDVRDVLYYSIKFRTRHFVLVHNHPSGDPKPSSEDIRLTKSISEAAKLLSLVLVDHVILGKQGYFSFKESTSVL